MFKEKAIKLFLILGVIIFSIIGIAGCTNEKVHEKKADNIISLSRNFIDGVAMSSIPRFRINLNYENSNFICKTYKGSFTGVPWDRKRIIKISSLNEVDYYAIVEENDYVDILICNDSGVFGYAVLEVLYTEPRKWEMNLIVSNLFVNEDGEIVNVTEKYANKIIKKYHK